jgi:hypothetical protein
MTSPTVNLDERYKLRELGSDVETITAAKTLTKDDNGKTYFLNNATGFATTLPAPAAGLNFKFILKAVLSSGDHTVVTSGAAAIIEGHIVVAGAVVLGVNEKQVNFKVTAGDVGDYVELTCDGTKWYLHGGAGASAGMTLTAP